MAQKIRILHLSDLHIPVNMDRSSEFSKLKSELFNDLSEQWKTDGDWDILVFSGDLIDKGNIEIFNNIELKNFINEILLKTGIPKSAMIIVPGNHDAKRPAKQSGVNIIRGNESDNSLGIDTLEELEVRFKYFRKFCNSFCRGMYKKDRTFGVKDIKIGDGYYRFIMVNSALGTRDICDYNNLFISKGQLESISNSINRKIKPLITVLVMHHPLDWLSYQERHLLQEFMEDECGFNVDIVLHGHVHDGSINLNSNLDSNIVTMVTGIGYERNEIYSDDRSHSQKPNHYRYATYEVEKANNKIHGILRKTNDKAVFRPDTSMYKKINIDGEFTIPIKINYDLQMYAVSLPLNGNKFITPLFLEKINYVLEKSREYRNYMKQDIDALLKRGNKKTASEKILSVFMRLCINFKLFYFKSLDSQYIRVHLRHYFPKDENHNAPYHDVIMSFYGEEKNTDPVSTIIWGNKNNLIYYAFRDKRTLLGTINKNMAYNNPDNKWDEYITVALTYNGFSPSNAPALSFGVSIKWDKMSKEQIDIIKDTLAAISYVGIESTLQEIISYLDSRVKIKTNFIPTNIGGEH